MKLTLRALAALLFCCLMPMAQAKRAPNLELKDLKGNKQTISSLRGSIVVINFWATWCVPCREELPLLSRLSQEYAGKKVRFIAASANEAKDRPKIDEFLSRNPLALEVWVGADLDMLEDAGLGNVLPATMILDDQGEIVARVQGEAREEDVRKPLEWLLSGRNGPAPQALTKRY
jgi:thiol-disulfide isomerase/thioredoxin